MDRYGVIVLLMQYWGSFIWGRVQYLCVEVGVFCLTCSKGSAKIQTSWVCGFGVFLLWFSRELSFSVQSKAELESKWKCKCMVRLECSRTSILWRHI